MQRIQAGDHALLREMNLSSVLRYLLYHSHASRSKLAQLSGLNKTTVSSLVDELIDRRLVYETGVETSGTGRPGKLLELNPNAGCIIGVSFGVDNITTVLTDFVGQVLWQRYLDIDPASPQEKILDAAFHLITEAMAVNTSHDARLLGMGLSLPGMVDARKGVLVFSPNLQWRDVPLRTLFRERLGLPLFMDNDANAASLAEHLFGNAQQVQNFIFIFGGVGIGGGLFLNGEVYRGATGFAGEIGHVNLMNERNRPCRCGKLGCWETLSNQYSILERVRLRLEVGRQSLISELMADQNSPLTLSVISQAADEGDPEVLEVLSETGAMIGLGTANLVNIFNPEMVILGGPISMLGHYMLSAIEQTVAEQTLLAMNQNLKVILSAFGPDASVIGAAAIVVEDILSRPTRVERQSH